MIANQAKIVSQYMPIEFFTELCAESATNHTALETARDGARYGAEGDANRPGDGTYQRISLAAN